MNEDNNLIMPMTIFLLSFILLLSYYISKKPLYVLDKNDNNKFSLRLSLIYSLLFSSALSLIFVAVDIVKQYYFK